MIRTASILIILLLNNTLTFADDPGEFIRSILFPRHALLLRHAPAPGTGDPPGFRLGDCSTQRNLSEQGRSAARELGDMIRKAGITAAKIYTSEWCRCVETAKLLELGPATPLPALNSFFQRAELEKKYTRELRAFLKEWSAGSDSGKPLILVTHQVNITGLTGIVPPSGGGVVVRWDEAGEVTVLGTWP